ncbi:MAG: hypothetical protein ACK4ZD_13490 [Caldimonas sp.]|uniref:hypothetical protein n=1 Tax=Caldimonas sp. TaxID=2838790 RepID=UPI00391A9D32
MQNLIDLSSGLLLLALAGTLLQFVFLGGLHFAMPKAVLSRYWRQPFFRPFELALFKWWLAPVRTIMLLAVMAFPAWGEKRGLTEAHRLAPRWYQAAAKVCVVGLIAVFVMAIIGSAGFMLSEWLTGGHPWKATFGLLLLLVCWGGVFWHQRHRGSGRSRKTAQGGR